MAISSAGVVAVAARKKARKKSRGYNKFSFHLQHHLEDKVDLLKKVESETSIGLLRSLLQTERKLHGQASRTASILSPRNREDSEHGLHTKSPKSLAQAGPGSPTASTALPQQSKLEWGAEPGNSPAEPGNAVETLEPGNSVETAPSQETGSSCFARFEASFRG
jgi:hypothetical protein